MADDDFSESSAWDHVFRMVKVHYLSWLDFDDIWDWLKAALDIGDRMSKRLWQFFVRF